MQSAQESSDDCSGNNALLPATASLRQAVARQCGTCRSAQHTRSRRLAAAVPCATPPAITAAQPAQPLTVSHTCAAPTHVANTPHNQQQTGVLAPASMHGEFLTHQHHHALEPSSLPVSVSSATVGASVPPWASMPPWGRRGGGGGGAGVRTAAEGGAGTGVRLTGFARFGGFGASGKANRLHSCTTVDRR